MRCHSHPVTSCFFSYSDSGADFRFVDSLGIDFVQSFICLLMLHAWGGWVSYWAVDCDVRSIFEAYIRIAIWNCGQIRKRGEYLFLITITFVLLYAICDTQGPYGLLSLLRSQGMVLRNTISWFYLVWSVRHIRSMPRFCYSFESRIRYFLGF